MIASDGGLAAHAGLATSVQLASPPYAKVDDPAFIYALSALVLLATVSVAMLAGAVKAFRKYGRD